MVSKALPTMSPVDPEWETLDPNPDLHSLFVEFNTAFFWGQLVSCEVKWSPRMTTCAGELLINSLCLRFVTRHLSVFASRGPLLDWHVNPPAEAAAQERHGGDIAT